MVQSTHARASCSRGTPVGAGDQPTPANLSAPELANVLASASWPSARTLTQKPPAWATRGQLVDDLPGPNATSGGSSDRLKNDWQVNPSGAAHRLP